jgi:hypothetical protein
MKECVEEIAVGGSIKLVEYRFGDCPSSDHENNIAIASLLIIIIVAIILSIKALRSQGDVE